MTKPLRVATGVGGTFTDLVAFETGPQGMKITTAKSATTPLDFESGVQSGLCPCGRGFHGPWNHGCDQRADRT
ncbi:hypothetical protein [Ascidiaceihabitans sp.]|uniref:hypothetical protein n=1 Tax=Ascidiaceihabitans sp. TaxID=1872644 RepID=UPI0032997BA0